MIYQVSGDILLSKAQLIAHGVAPNDPMKQGLALSLHEKYPSMHKDFHHWCNQNHPKPGEAWIWGGTEGVCIANLLTQGGGYGHGSQPEKATLKHVRDALKALVKIIKKESFTSVAIPKIATGVGGLQWEDVWSVIQVKFEKLDIPVYVYTEFHAGQQGKEPNLLKENR
ncbi:MAG TPA: Appr-1-p processing protein [Thiotrichaceae bacterium]|jgi:O-acetyl-ADP-ribose deacetylase (regulator of RNase III)|nr:Appr-1-p processing protein [Thiotrichaceae bacterium]HIM09134.1 Appr-1-p processing protein [Gammaproteobacteria bacterium]